MLCYVWLKEPYRIQEALAGFISMAGVLLIARPEFLFRTDSPTVGAPSSPHRAVAVIFAILGTFGAATAYSTIRQIGKRAHSLISVNYFAVLSTVGSALLIWVDPNLSFYLPQGALQWTLLFIIGVAGFLLQFLLTEGLQREKGGRATNMTYFQMVFTLILERAVWGTTPPLLSLAGSGLIIGAAVWLSLQKTKPEKTRAVVDEETSLLRPENSQ
ncbi:hypothetical protein F5Y16DRAFT_394336 [Xylariaceae sp. FL0255]|nr:hypothetical protein F5Y16DRAFT_394336 [Xylariaceae sp. FL0255]